MTDHADLVARLRTVCDQDAEQAADALEAAAERERRQHEALEEWRASFQRQEQRAEHWEAEAKRYAENAEHHREKREAAESEYAALRRAVEAFYADPGRARWRIGGTDDQLRRLLSTPSPGAALLEELTQAKAENERLRESIVGIDSFITSMTLDPVPQLPHEHAGLKHCRCVYAVREMTRRALETK